MNKSLDNKLSKTFPLLYADRYLDRHKHRDTLMPYGFGCSDGWYRIIYQFSEKAEKEIRSIVRKNKVKNFILKAINYFSTDNRFEYHSHPKAFQVKQKFGYLRIYMSDSTVRLDKLIQEAEEASFHTCEVCGDEGSLRKDTNYWRTLCKSCAIKRPGHL